MIVDSATLENEWITVKTGMMGGEHLVPITAVEEDADQITIPFAKDDVKAAPDSRQGPRRPLPERAGPGLLPLRNGRSRPPVPLLT